MVIIYINFNSQELKAPPNKGIGKNRTGPFSRKSGYMSCIDPVTNNAKQPEHLPVKPMSGQLGQTQSSESSIPSEYKLPQDAKKKKNKVSLTSPL